MSAIQTIPSEFERQPLHEFTERAYLDYSMYVILDRALPHLADGLKPVQRRIVYAMSELGLNAGAKFKKSARTVGDVLGKYHPHGDSACYEAMVLMAQPFSYRYPLVDGQGNWGSQDDPKSFAAMRYTESRLTPYAAMLLAELEQGTVEWGPNFDGTLQEPALLPARLPNVLLNGSTGIAVGMATDIPPHNLNEVAAALARLLDQPDCTVAQLCEHVKGPDYPTEAEIITLPEELLKIYETGAGTVRMRAVYEIEDNDIIITALPYQTSGAKVLAQIAEQMQAKKLPMLEDLRDESDHENPVRLVLVPRGRKTEAEPLMAHLFATTDLERTYRVNLNMIGLDGKPQQKNLKQILQEWLNFRLATVRRRLNYRLDKVTQRMHILDGLLIAYLNIDEIIKIIRVKDNPKPLLMARFKLSETQVEAILELRLRQLAKLEETKIRGEQDNLGKERKMLETILGSEGELRKLVRGELLRDAKEYGDARRSPIIRREQAKPLEKTDLQPAEPITVILSEKGWVRAAKGHEIEADKFNYRAGDGFLSACRGFSNQLAVFFDTSGRSYALPANSLPSARGLGEPLAGRLTPPDGTRWLSVLMGADEEEYLLASDAGYGFIAPLSELQAKNKAGKLVLNPPSESVALPPIRIADSAGSLAVFDDQGHLLVFPLEQLPRMAKGKGVKLMNLKPGERITRLAVLPPNAGLALAAGKRPFSLKGEALAGYQGERAQRGHMLPKGLQKIEQCELILPPTEAEVLF